MRAFAVIWSPVRVLREIAEERNVLAGFIVVAISAVLSLASVATLLSVGDLQSQIEASGAQLPEGFFEGFSVITLILSVVGSFVWWLLVSLLMQLVTRFFGGEGPFSATLAVVGASFAPFVLSAALTLPLGVLQATLETASSAAMVVGLLSNLISLTFFVWHAILVVVGVALARNIGYGESSGSCAISCGGCVGIIILVIVVLALIFGIIAGAASQ